MTLDVNADYMSSPQAAKALRITHVGVAQLARQGKIPAVKIANRWLIPRSFVEEFARTYDGKRGRPRKKLPPALRHSAPLSVIQPAWAEMSNATNTGVSQAESSGILVINAWPPDLEDTPTPPIPNVEMLPAGSTGDAGVRASSPTLDAASAINQQRVQEDAIQVAAPQPDESSPREPIPLSETAASTEPESGASLNGGALVDSFQNVVASAPPASEPGMSEAVAAPEAPDNGGSAKGAFSISAEVFHLDKNYDFEVYEKGQITEQARLILARLKPKIPSLPQFSFRWDYRYEHLNVDIHGVEPAVVDWWTIGENGYTGHLPRRLAGPGYAFEAIIWLPVTFVFRGRLTISLGDGRGDREESPSVATTTGGLRKLWARWPSSPPK